MYIGYGANIETLYAIRRTMLAWQNQKMAEN
jgi:hypothetical protein